MLRPAVVALACAAGATAASSFVTRSGTQLELDSVPFRYAGANIYWLGLDENVPPGAVAYPTQFRVADALEAAVAMGATVIRGHTLGISTGNPLSFEPTLNVFNESARAMADFALYYAGKLGLRVIVPLTDNYHYYHGGKHDFTDWRGLSDENDFYTNDTVIGDFETYITRLLTHVNPFTNLAWKDDPTVMAWETGNELLPPTAWTARISAFLKSLDPNHLVMDGTFGINAGSLNLSTVDLYSDHFYPMDNGRLTLDATLVSAADKVFIVGELGWSDGNLSSFLATIEATPTVAGDTYWSLFPHLDTGGLEPHGDGFTVHCPGVDTPAMGAAVTLLRNHAFAMRGVAPPPAFAAPPSPLVLSAARVNVSTSALSLALVWRGVVCADAYTVETATASAQGPWSTVCTACATDAQVSASAPWVSAPLPGSAGSALWVRLTAVSLGGAASPPSAAFPVPAA